MTRQLRYGAYPPPRSQFTTSRVIPDRGYSDLPDITAGESSVVSGQNCWIWQERLTPRPRLLNSLNPLSDIPVGAFQHFDVAGTQYPMIFSSGTASQNVAGNWTTLTYASGASNNAPTGGSRDWIFGTSVYLPRADQNLAVWVNGVDPAFCWTNGTTYSTLTQSYIAHDVTVANNRLVYWNVRYLSSSSQLVTRVAWTASGNPEDTTSFIGPGYVDLLDMHGVGTRCFTLGDQIVVATDQEIWRGTFVGDPYTYDFHRVTDTVGMPYARAAILIPEGLFFVGADMMVYRGLELEQVGKPVQRTLHNAVADPATMFFGYHSDAKMLTLYYTDSVGPYPNRGLTLNLLTGQWMPQKYSQNLVVAFSSYQASSATTWGALSAPLVQNTLTYNQLLGLPVKGYSEAVAASAGTTYLLSHSATSDDGVPVYEEATLGPLFASISEQRKYTDTVRVDVQADSASSLSVALSGDNGMSFPGEVSFTASQSSNGSQYVTRPGGVNGVYPLVRIRSTGGQWNVLSVTARGRLDGEQF